MILSVIVILRWVSCDYLNFNSNALYFATYHNPNIEARTGIEHKQKPVRPSNTPPQNRSSVLEMDLSSLIEVTSGSAPSSVRSGANSIYHSLMIVPRDQNTANQSPLIVPRDTKPVSRDKVKSSVVEPSRDPLIMRSYLGLLQYTVKVWWSLFNSLESLVITEDPYFDQFLQSDGFSFFRLYFSSAEKRPIV